MLLNLLLALIVLGILIYAVNIIVSMFTVDARIKQLILLVVGVLAIIYLLKLFGLSLPGGL